MSPPLPIPKPHSTSSSTLGETFRSQDISGLLHAGERLEVESHPTIQEAQESVDSSPQFFLKIIYLPRNHGRRDHARILVQRCNALVSHLQHTTHPHVYSIPALFFDPSTDFPALRMPLFRRGNIIDYLLAEQLSGVDHAQRLLITETSDGLSFLHKNSIVHGNVRGSNILITVAGHALLVDTGISATVADTCEYIPLPMNASWMAPELFVWEETEQAEATRENPCTSMSDVYSFGRTIEEVCTLKPPFSNVTARNRMHFIVKLRALLLMPPAQPPGMPSEMWSVMKSCLAVNPDERPSAQALHQVLSG